MTPRLFRRSALVATLLLLAACASPPQPEPPPAAPQLPPEVAAHYAGLVDAGIEIPAVPAKYLADRNIRREVDYWSDEKPGTVIVDPWQRFLYYVQPGNRAIRYGVAVGDEGRAFAGTAHIPYSRDWPSWIPTENMIREFPDVYGPLRKGMEGGLMNPLGARALYLHKGNRDTFYRIHGTTDMASIGNATSAGCIRMFHQDVIELERLVRSGARVVVLTEEESGKGTVNPAHEAVAQSAGEAVSLL
ncbi:L,D-transpeptidase [Paracoccus aminophilus]|uniref:ErfK/YbiS/YcfS/YnhG family protein n=1 Tax=Paracoccus aminophilus JCM 7686 TaxID=1367847 RepID=S5YI85_PARAH|nr:L,D-transpeptidase [Paracoccus aminophilus]AGT11188.1 ErfK/YbiS/YcfS/YnhG family protein [Paracoccus aminophilus JCM 7686]